jgi:beta-galactosidase
VADVAYRDGRYWIDGEPHFVCAADHQYYRDRPERWPERLEQLKAARVDTITFYVPWRHHWIDGAYDFTGATRANRDLVGYLAAVKAAGLWAVAKPGPFVHSELNIGGLPDGTSPSFGAAIEPVRTHEGKPLLWGYDQTQLPSSEDPTFDAMALAWLRAVGEVLAPFAAPGGPLIGLQLNDETLYCSSNAPPWTYGYEEAGLAAYRRLLAERYGSVQRYDALHGTYHAAFADVAPPKPGLRPTRVEELLVLADWAEYQWRLRRDSYARYKAALGLDLPCLSNFAGITPPIEENVPGQDASAEPELPPDLAPLYPEWWLAMNRVDADADVYHYGMISWLGVAAYDIPDPRSVDLDRPGDAVFQRYINTAGRRRGINVEENWGFAQLYHPFSKHPVVPVFQSLASVAGGCTGYVVFCGVQHADWDDDLDRITRQQWPTFPSDAPIADDGTTNALYDAMAQLNGWLAREGQALLRCEPRADACWLVYPPYAAASGWLPQERVGDHATPRSGVDMEAFAGALQRAGRWTDVTELDAADDLSRWPLCALRLGPFMDEASQRRLVDFARQGGQLVLTGELPTRDLELRGCTVLRDALAEASGEAPAAPATGEARIPLGEGWVVRGRTDLFASGRIVTLAEDLLGPPPLSTSPGLRAFVHTSDAGDDAPQDAFVFWFHFGREPAEGWVDLRGLGRLELRLGSKTCGAARIHVGQLVSAYAKGSNEVEDVTSDVSVRWGDREASAHGDLLWFHDPAK